MGVYIRKSMLVLLDIIIINVAVFSSLFFKFNGNIPDNFYLIYINSAVITTLINIAIYFLFGLYKSLWKYAGERELIQIFFATLFGMAAKLIFSIITDSFLPRDVYVVGWATTFIMISGSRMAYRILRRRKFRVKNIYDESQRTMIVGAGDAASMLIKDIRNHPEYNVIPIISVDDDKDKKGSMINGVPIKGNRNDIKRLVRKYNIKKIIIAMPSVKKSEVANILSICKETKCKLKILPGIGEIINDKAGIKIREVSVEDLLRRDEITLDNDLIASYLKDEVVLITGGGGSIGSELSRQIAKYEPSKLIIFDIYENNAYELEQELLSEYQGKLDIKVLIGSVRDKKRLEQVFSEYRPGIVFHAAAHKHVPLMEANPCEAVKNNVIGTLNTAKCADEYGAKRFVLISTDKAVNPSSIMGATKRLAEILIHTMDYISKTGFVSVRFGNVLGSKGSVLPLFKKQIEKGGPVLVTHPEMTRYFMTMAEAAQLVINAGAIAKGGEIFILDMGEQIKIKDLAIELIKLSGFEPDYDIKIEYVGLRPGEKLSEELIQNQQAITETANKKILVDFTPLTTNFDEVMLQIELLINSINEPSKLRECLFDVVSAYCANKKGDATAQRNSC